MVLARLLGVVTGVVSTFGGLILQVANSLILSVALTLAGLCGAALTGRGLALTLEQQVKASLQQQLADFDLALHVTSPSLDVLAPIRGALFAFLVLALFLAAIAVVGIVAVSTKNSILLTVYACVLSLTFIVELALVLSVRSGPGRLDRAVKAGVKTSFRQLYSGPTATDPVSLVWNGAMANFQCCGVDDYTDFKHTRRWNRTIHFQGRDLTVDMPLECCKSRDSGDKWEHLLNCTNRHSDRNFKHQGCYTRCWQNLQDMVRSLSGGAIISTAFLIQIAAIVVVVIMVVNGFTPSVYNPL